MRRGEERRGEERRGEERRGEERRGEERRGEERRGEERSLAADADGCLKQPQPAANVGRTLLLVWLLTDCRSAGGPADNEEGSAFYMAVFELAWG